VAIVEVKPLEARGSSINEKFERTYHRSYLVTTNAVTDDEYAIRTGLAGYSDPHDGAILQLFKGYPADPQARCRSVAVECAEVGLYDTANPTLLGNKWLATLEWGLISPLEAADTGDPVDATPEVSIDGVVFERIAIVDKDGNPLVNSAGDPFNPPITIDDQRHVIKIKRNEMAQPIDAILANANTINSLEWYTWPAFTVKCEPMLIQMLYNQFLDATYFRIEYTFIYNPMTWLRKIFDAGMRQLDASGNVQQIMIEGFPATEPAFLDGTGHYLPPPVTTSSLYEWDFHVYKEVDFNTAFSFPSDIFGPEGLLRRGP
jgi:hypothetical protein